MGDKIKPEVPLELGGKTYYLRWDNEALFELQAYSNLSDFGDFRKACIMIYCMLCGKHPFKSPKQIAGLLDPSKLGYVAKQLIKAQELGTVTLPAQEDGDDPLESGHSPAED